MMPDEKVLVFSNPVKQLTLVLKSMKVGIDKKKLAMAVQNGLPPKFEHLIVALDAISEND